MKLSILNKDGSDSGKKATLSKDIFVIEPNDQLIYEDVRSYQSNQRQGTAKTKGRSEVRGGGKKAFRQKGTGGARRGTMRSPLLKGGGTVFGPQPRDYEVKLTKKMRQIARKSALSYKAKDKAIVVVEDFSMETPNTSEFLNVLKALQVADKKVLFLTAQTDLKIYKSGRNLPKVSVLEAAKPSTYEILNADVLVMQHSALPVLEGTFNAKTTEAVA